MKAVIRTQYGDAKVLQVTTLERPVPQKHEVLVRVRAAGLDYGQWHLMTGEPYVMRLATGLTKPKQPVLGADVSGVVEAVGAEVTRFKVGDAVFGASSRTFAEFACAREDQLCLKPERLSFEQAAASAISGVTALIGLRDLAKVKPGQSVCVIGAGGGVGSWAVQLARHFGGRVTAVCSTSKVEFVHALGAAAVKCSKHSVHNVVNMPHQVGSRRAGQSGGLRGMSHQVRVPMRIVRGLRRPQWSRQLSGSELIVDVLHAHLGKQVCAFIRPTHLLALGHAQADDLVDGRLGNAAADRQASVVSSGVVHQSGVVSDVPGRLVQIPPQRGELIATACAQLGIQRQQSGAALAGLAMPDQPFGMADLSLDVVALPGLDLPAPIE